MAKSSTTWTKGQSGNPAGKPRKLPEVRARIEELTEDAVKTLATLCRSKKVEPKDRIAASKALLEWGIPKPQQQVSTGELDKIEAICAALADDSEDEKEAVSGS